VERVYYYTSSQSGDKTDHNNYYGISLLSASHKILPNILLPRLSPYVELMGIIISVGFDVKKVYDSLRKEILCNILTEFGVPMKLVWLIKMCLNRMKSKVHRGKTYF
jgi:hypothetical protein